MEKTILPVIESLSPLLLHQTLDETPEIFAFSFYSANLVAKWNQTSHAKYYH